MRFRKTALDEITARIAQLGLSRCPVCSATESMVADRRPVVIPLGGAPWMPDGQRGEPEVNILFLILLKCRLCGHVLLFDSEEFEGADARALIVGMTYEEEDELEASGEG
jgi:hypothetical protein